MFTCEVQVAGTTHYYWLVHNGLFLFVLETASGFDEHELEWAERDSKRAVAALNGLGLK